MGPTDRKDFGSLRSHKGHSELKIHFGLGKPYKGRVGVLCFLML